MEIHIANKQGLIFAPPLAYIAYIGLSFLVSITTERFCTSVPYLISKYYIVCQIRVFCPRRNSLCLTFPASNVASLVTEPIC